MAEGLRPPGPFKLAGDGEKNQRWEKWIEQFDFYMKATEKDKKSKAVQVAVLLTLLGEDGMEIYRTFQYEDASHKDDIAKVKEKFSEYYTPRINVTYERYKFLKRKQNEGEQFESFLTSLMNLASSCKYDDSEKNNIIRDQVVIGIQCDAVRRDLLYEKDLTLETAINICRNKEATAHYSESMKATPAATHTGEVSAVKKKFAKGSRKANFRPNSTSHSQASTHRPTQSSHESRKCHRCDTSHAPRSCPAYGKQCRKCKKYNHFAKCCRQSSIEKGKADMVNFRDEAETYDLFAYAVEQEREQESPACANTVDSKPKRKRQWFVTVMINGHSPSFKVDTGADCNVMGKHTCDQLLGPNDKFQKSKQGAKLNLYGGPQLTVVGRCQFTVEYKGIYDVQEYIVVNEKVVTLLGLPSCIDLGIVNCVDSVADDYADVFKGIGCIPGEHHIAVKPDVTPTIYAARRVPHRIRQKFKTELDSMEKKGLIKKVTEPTEWVNPLVVVLKKNGSLRICLDPGPLNMAVQREHYTLPTAEDIFSRLHNSAYFTTLDATSGFMQMALDEPSSYLTTFATPFGRYRYTRLPYGLSSAPEVYHRVIGDHFGDLEGVETFIDDILVHAPTEELHDQRLNAVLERCRKINLTLNREKCTFRSSEVTYLGHVIGANTLKADPRKIEAIVNMPTPDSKESVRRLLGMLTYLGKFCPSLSDMTLPLRDLTRHDTCWTWDSQHEQCLARIKEAVLKPPVLKLFNPEEEVTLSVDASKSGLGAVILQNGLPVEYASCTLTPTQQRYAQVEKEMIAIQWGLVRFHQYTYGQPLTVETDHKPLLSIVKQPIADLSPRLQRMRMRCSFYDFNLVYKPGKELHVADFLSRAQLSSTYESTDQHDEEAVHAVCSYVLANELSKKRIQEFTVKDQTLQLLKETVNKGWPRKKKLCPDVLKPYWNSRNIICEHDGVLFKGEQVVVPVALRPEAIKNIHEGHMGIVKCIDRAKSCAYWPGYIQHIKDAVEGCSLCQKYRDANPHAPLQQHEVPDYPYQVLGSDLFELNGTSYLLTVDYFSKWPCVEKLQETKTIDVIKVLEKQFCDFGVPQKLVTDNGPQYGSAEFREFMQKLRIEHVTSSPQYAQSNGMAERTVKTVKASMKKMLAEGKNLLQVLSAIRSTPVGKDLPTPAVLLQGRNLRCSLHQLPEALKPQHVDYQAIRQKLQCRQADYSYYHDAHKRAPKGTFQPGDIVRTRQAGVWIPARVQAHDRMPQSYWLELQSGRVVRRNCRQINRTSENIEWPTHTGPTPRPVRTMPRSTSTVPRSTSTVPRTTSTVPNRPTVPNVSNLPESDTTPQHQAPDVMPETRSTRSGRVIHKPHRYMD